MKLGQFIQDKNGAFHGKVKAYGFAEVAVLISPKTSQDGKLYYEIIGNPTQGGFDGGAAFPKQKGNLEYLSVTMDSPVFPVPIHAGLFQDKVEAGCFNLVWDRQVQPKIAPTNDVMGEKPATAQPQKRSMFFSRNP